MIMKVNTKTIHVSIIQMALHTSLYMHQFNLRNVCIRDDAELKGVDFDFANIV